MHLDVYFSTTCIWIRMDSCSTKGISAKPSMEELGTFSHITHELPLVILHPWSLNPGNNSPRQNLSVVLGSNMDANCFQKSRTRQSNKRNSEKLKLGCEKTHEAQRDILTTIDFHCAGWCHWLLWKRECICHWISLCFHIFFWFLWDFWVLKANFKSTSPGRPRSA